MASALEHVDQTFCHICKLEQLTCLCLKTLILCCLCFDCLFFLLCLQPLGHWWGNFEGVDTALAPQGESARLLDYVEAREKIYVPAYMSVIERPATHEKLVELAHRAMHKDIVLLDYFTNDDVANTTTPLSHAGLVRKYLVEHEEELLNAVPPGS